MSLLHLLIGGAVIAANIYSNGKKNASDDDWNDMSTSEKLNNMAEGTCKAVEKKNEEIQKRIKSELRKKSDDEIKRIIQTGSNETVRELAAEEAERRGI